MERIILDDCLDAPLYIQIYKYYKTEISQGRLKEGNKLPSIRQLTMDLKVSKTTVEAAYNQLVVEGYVNNLPKRGYYVVSLNDSYFHTNAYQDIAMEKEVNKTFINNGVDKNSFDMKSWRKLYSYILQTTNDAVYTGGDEQGELFLRNNISAFVQKTRGVNCNPGQIIVGAGVQYLLGILCSLLKEDIHHIALEYPGFKQAENVFQNYGMHTLPIPVNEDGIDIELLKKSNAELVYISPSHQYPTGSIMPINKRIQILNWAKENNATIIEDDYDGLIRYETRPIPALQGLSNGKHVIYFGSFSKLLLPSIRISYMILPEDILQRYVKHRSRYAQSASKLEQLTLGQFMQEGYFEKHLRKIKKIYHRKNEMIIDFIHQHAENKIKILGHDSGLHMMFEVTSEKSTQDILFSAKTLNIYLEAVEGYNKSKPLIVFTYSGIQENEINNVLRMLLRIID
ncbi:MAG: PLP-dependent aminotransferase family protein [Eubacteriales bacterium]